jgi:mono/diheme cytochrome c family protein
MRRSGQWLGVLVVGAVASVGASTVAVADQSVVERGRYLVETIAGCGNCHTPMGPNGPDMSRYLAGGFVFDEPVFRAVSANITPDPETGIGAWSDAEIARAIREGIRPDGSLIGPPMPFSLYHGIADDDVAAMVAYLRSVPPVENAVERSVYNIPLPLAWTAPIETVAAPDPDDPVAYGAYLAGPVGHCVECHTPMNEDGHPDFEHRIGAGGFVFRGPWGESIAANITPAGLGDWSDAEIEHAIRDGVSRDGRQLMPPMGFAYYKGISDGDMAALIAYLRSLPAVE